MSTPDRPKRLSHSETSRPPNLGDYPRARAEFAWSDVLAELASAQGRINIAYAAVAPDADTTNLDDQAELRDALDIDSMDLLNVLVGIDDKLHVSVPERDYGKVPTLGALVAYVDARPG